MYPITDNRCIFNKHIGGFMKIQLRLTIEGQLIGGGWEDNCQSLIVNGVEIIRNGQPNLELAQIEEQQEEVPTLREIN